MSSPAPHELWKQADGDAERYRQLMVEHGHVVPGEPRPLPCGYDVLGPSAQQRIDGMGDDPAWDEAIAKAGDSGYMDAAAVPVPDAGDDTLRRAIVTTIGNHTVPIKATLLNGEQTWPASIHILIGESEVAELADALLPRIREHVAGLALGMQSWRERAETAEVEVNRMTQALAESAIFGTPTEAWRLLAALADPADCTHDHHGHCQAHGWTQTDPACPHARAKLLLHQVEQIRHTSIPTVRHRIVPGGREEIELICNECDVNVHAEGDNLDGLGLFVTRWHQIWHGKATP